MSELYLLTEALAFLQDDQRNLQENQQLILERLEELKTKLDQLDRKIDERVLVDFRTGMSHLLAGYNSDLEDVRKEEFRRARDIFSTLMSLNPQEKTAGTSGEVDNPTLICVGYWGSYQYFSLQGDYRNALLHAYRCTELYPNIAALGLGLFPAQLFSKDYTTLWRNAYRELAEVSEAYNKCKARNKSEKLAFYAKQPLRVYATYVTVGILGWVDMFKGFSLAKKVWNSTLFRRPDIRSVEELESEIERLTTVLNDLPAELVKECQMRQTQLQRTTLKELQHAISPKMQRH